LLVHFSIQEADAADLELAAHNALLKQRLSGEWFNAPLSDIIAAIERRGAVVSVAPVTMTAPSFINWLADMKSAGLARSDAAAAKLLGVSANAVVEMKKRGADRRTALACRALRHCMEPYE
jgi:phage I-like protein